MENVIMIYCKFKIYESVYMVGKMGLRVLAKFNYYLNSGIRFH